MLTRVVLMTSSPILIPIRRSSLVTVTIPSSVTLVGESAFSRCGSLARIVIPSSVTAIAELAFYNCSSLVSVALPSSLGRIEDSLFEGCTSLATVAIPDSVKRIGEGAFSRCSSLAWVEVPSSVDTIGASAFEGCTSLALLSLSATLEEMMEDVFYGCRALETLLVQPATPLAAPSPIWATLLNGSRGGDNDVGDDVEGDANEDDGGSDVDAHADVDNEDYVDYVDDDDNESTMLPCIKRVWASDEVVAQFGGRFSQFQRRAALPAGMSAAPDANTWEGVQLWWWWSHPRGVRNDGNQHAMPATVAFAKGDRVVCASRLTTLWATMLSGFRAAQVKIVPHLPQELWLCIFGFLKHEQPPAYWTAAEYGSDDDDD